MICDNFGLIELIYRNVYNAKVWGNTTTPESLTTSSYHERNY